MRSGGKSQPMGTLGAASRENGEGGGEELEVAPNPDSGATAPVPRAAPASLSAGSGALSHSLRFRKS